MKKLYSTPLVDVHSLRLVNTVATSLPVTGTTDDEARSSSYWGETLFDQEEPEEETDIWDV